MAAESNARSLDDSDITIDRMDLAGLEEFFLENEEIFNRGLTLKQAVFYYGDTRKSLKAKVEDGSIPAIRLPEEHGRKWRVFPDGVPEQFQHLIPPKGARPPKKLRRKDSQGAKKQKASSESEAQTDKHIASLHVSGAVTPKLVPDYIEPGFPDIPDPPRYGYPELDFEPPVEMNSGQEPERISPEEELPGDLKIPYVQVQEQDLPYVELEEYILPDVEIASPISLIEALEESATDQGMLEGSAVDTVQESAIWVTDGSQIDTADGSQIDTAERSQIDTAERSQIDTIERSQIDTADGSQIDTAYGAQQATQDSDEQSESQAAGRTYSHDGGSLVEALSIYGAELWIPAPAEETEISCKRMPDTGIEIELDSFVPASTAMESLQIYAGEFVEPEQQFDPWENFDAECESPWIWDTPIDREFLRSRAAFLGSPTPTAEPAMPEMPTMYFGTDTQRYQGDPIVELPTIEHALQAHGIPARNGFLKFSQMVLPTSPCVNTIAPASSNQLLEKIEDLEKQLEAIAYRNNYLESRVLGLEDQVKFLSQSSYQNRGFNKLLILLPCLALLAIMYLIRFASIATP